MAWRFLPWSHHPDRDEEWYRTSPEVLTLKPHKRAEQYPSTWAEAFMFSRALYFDEEALYWYGQEPERVRSPLYRAQWIASRRKDRARLSKRDDGWISVYEEPKEGASYALAADVATGRGLDFSAAYVIDLGTMAFVAEVHAKIDASLYAEQLHYLGRWYNDAKVAVEDAGGFGEPVIIFLRDGKDGRRPYPNMYRHRQFSRGDQPEHRPWGFPMSTKTRPLVLEALEKAVREKALPWLTPGLMGEMGTFVHREDRSPSPAAQEGCNDDRVMAAAIAVEMFRQYGHHPRQVRTKGKRRADYRAPFSWQQRRTAA
jgi:hypothetical protein